MGKSKQCILSITIDKPIKPILPAMPPPPSLHRSLARGDRPASIHIYICTTSSRTYLGLRYLRIWVGWSGPGQMAYIANRINMVGGDYSSEEYILQPPCLLHPNSKLLLIYSKWSVHRRLSDDQSILVWKLCNPSFGPALDPCMKKFWQCTMS